MEATTVSKHREVSATDTGEKENQDLNTHKVVSGSGHRGNETQVTTIKDNERGREIN